MDGPCWVAVLAQMEPSRYLQVDVEEEVTKAFERADFPFSEYRQWFVRAARRRGKTNMEDGQWEIKRPVAPQSSGSETSRIQHEEDFKDGERDHKNCLSSQV